MGIPMNVIQGKARDQQLIILPTANETLQLQKSRTNTQKISFSTGRQCIVLSGFIDCHTGLRASGDAIIQGEQTVDNDEATLETEIQSEVGPAWILVNQVSAHAALASFSSNDADEVDHSTFAVKKVAWEFVQSTTHSDDRLRLKITIAIRGILNMVDSLSFHVVVTGTLSRLPFLSELSTPLK
jgi:hypothetical protein